MLRGMAVECQLKAVLFARRHFEGPFTLADRDALGRWFRSHDLRRLAKEAGVGPTDDELRVLGMLAAFVRWAGRYPAPISQGEGWALPRWRVPDDDDAFDGLWNRIEGAAPRASRADEGAGGDGPARPSGSTDA